MLKYQETSPGWEITKIRMLQYTRARIILQTESSIEV